MPYAHISHMLTAQSRSKVMQDQPKHFLVITYEGWGLCRPLVSLALKLLTLRSHHLVTLLVPGGFTDKVTNEIKRFRLDGDQSARLKVIHFAETEARGDGGRIYLDERDAILEALLDGVEPLIGPILECQPVNDTITGSAQATHHVKPHLIISDILLTYSDDRPITQTIRSEEEKRGLSRIPIVIWIPISAASFAWQFLSEVSPGPRLAREVEQRVKVGEAKDQVYRELVLQNDLVVKLPRCGPMHVYEMEPNGTDYSLPPVGGRLCLGQADGIAFNWPACMSQEVLEIAQSKWKIACAISPFGIPLATKDSRQHQSASTHITEFLDSALISHGPRSVLYISFGTWNYPPSLAQTQILLDVLKQVAIPYIFLPGVAPPESRMLIQDAVKQSNGLGMTADWASQVDILNHPATSAFLSHAGSNSVMETITANVPLVLWPGGIDQPMIANELSLKEGVAVELLQIRRGEHIGRKTGTGLLVTGDPEIMRQELLAVIDDIATSGPTVMRLRAAIETLHTRLAGDVQPGGFSHERLLALADYC